MCKNYQPDLSYTAETRTLHSFSKFALFHFTMGTNIWSYGRKYDLDKLVWNCHWFFPGHFTNPLSIFVLCGWGSPPFGWLWLSYIWVLWLYSHVCLCWSNLKPWLFENRLWMILNSRGVEWKSRSKSAQHEKRLKKTCCREKCFLFKLDLA